MSLKFLLVLKSFNGISRLFKVCLKFQGCFKEVSGKISRVSPESFMGGSTKIEGSFK